MIFPLTLEPDEVHGHKGSWNDDCEECLAYYKGYEVKGVRMITIPTPENWKCEKCSADYFHKHGTYDVPDNHGNASNS